MFEWIFFKFTRCVASFIHSSKRLLLFYCYFLTYYCIRMESTGMYF